MTIRDLLGEASAGLSRRLGRATLTSLGTVLGVGALVATLGLTSTAAAQIGSRFDRLKATEVTVQDPEYDPHGLPVFPPETDSILERLNGVVAGGQFWTVTRDAVAVSPAATSEANFITVQAISPGALRAMDPLLATGTPYSSFAQDRNEPVVVIGLGLLTQLGIPLLAATHAAVRVDGHLLSIVAVVSDVRRNPVLISGIAVPTSTAISLWGDQGASSCQVLIETRLGAAQLIARQAPLALLPSDPKRLIALAPPNPGSLRRGVESDVSSLFVALAMVSLAIGGLSIANTTLISVLERVPEIGLRRALGATRWSVAMQFLLESTVLGGVGGIFGTCISIVFVVVVSGVKAWTPVMDPVVTIAGPMLGLLTGLVAGLYPAAKAAHVQPIVALRR